jgi:hypothetical protein
MLNAWRAIADDIMAFLIVQGVRPTPHRYAVVSYLADHSMIDEQRTDIFIGDGGATVNRAILRRTIEILLREGLVEPAGSGVAYRLRPAEAWGDAPASDEDTDGPRLAAAG